MKLTKGMKKALSLLLSAAMVVTGVNVTTNAAKADDTKSKLVASWEGSMSLEKSGNTYTSKVTTDKSEAVSKAALSVWESGTNDWWGGANVNYAEVAQYDKVTVKITGTAAEDSFVSVTTNSAIKNSANVKVAKGDFVETVEFTPVETSKVTVGIGQDNMAVTLKKVEIFDGDAPAAEPSASATGSATESSNPATGSATTEPSTEPDDPNYQVPAAEGYKAFLMFASSDWSVQNMDADANGTDAVVTGNGTYTVSLDLEEGQAVEAAQVFCVDIKGLANAQNLDVSNMSIKDVVVKCDDQVVETDMSHMYFGCIEGEGNTRLEIYNAWGYSNDENENDFTTADEVDPEAFAFTKSISVTFTLDGIKKGATVTEGNYTIKTGTGDVAGEIKRKTPKTPAPEVSEDPAASNDPATSSDPTTSSDPAASNPAASNPAASNPAASKNPAASNPAASKNPAASNPAAKTATPAGVKSATPAGIKTATPAGIKSVKGTSKITAKKKIVIVAPGKKTTVKYTVKKAAGTSGAAVVKASSASKKIATVSLNTKKKVLTIKVPKKATKGASTTVTLKSKKKDGKKQATAKIKVYVRNSAKKVKAAKKSITFKKNQTKKLVIKASKVQNKKKAFVDTITVKGKVLKLTNVKYAKGKATLTLKAVKKAKKKAITIKVGKKSVKVKATVK